MNKVFKVIWSEARNAYVVVSEIAKNHGSKSCSTKKLLTMLIATGVMTCASMAPAMAANPASDDLNVTIGKGAHVSVWNSVSGQTISGDIAVGPNAHAWNGEYTYRNKYARIGSKEYLLDFGQGGVVGAESIFGVPYKYKVADGSKIAGSIAIGKNTVARTGSVMLGDHSYTGKLGDIEINPANAMTYNDGIYSTTLGAGAYNSGSLAAVTGALSIASGSDTKNTGATIYGSMNSIESATSSSSYSGVASSVLGFANRTQNANAALIWGTGNEVTNSIEKVGIDTNWNNVSVAEAQKKAIEAMQSSDYAGGSVMAIGGGNKADYAKYSQLTGVKNKVTGTEAKAAQYDFVNGYQNTVTNASDVTVIGIKNEVTADGNKVIGDNQKVSGKNNVIFGSADKVTETTVNNAVVLGHNAKVTGEGGVALGAGSVADRNNAVSVGSTGANRQIINVAAGEADTDAVNVSQLKKATANANKGWKLSTEGGTANQVASEATVNFSGKKDAGGHQNITVSNEGNNVKIELASELKNVTGVVNGNSRVTLGTGIAGITNGQESVIMMNGSTTINGVVGIDNTGKISGVANGEADKDAVNYGQLKDVKAEALKHSTVTNGDNIAVTETTNKDGGKEYKVALNNDIHLFGDNGAMVSISGSHGTIWTSGSVTAGSVVAGDVVMDSTTATVSGLGNKTTAYAGFATTGKAATEEQLKEVATEAGKHTTLVAGDNVTLDKKETDKGLEYTVNAVDTKYTAGNGITIDAAANNAISVNLKEGEVNLAVDEKGLSLNKDLQGIESISNNTSKLVLREGWAGMQNGVGASVFMVGGLTTINDKVTVDEQGKISGVAAGTADTDAVNYGQLKDVKTEAGKHTTLSDGKNTTVAPTVKDGQTDYKVNVAGDLTDITSVANGGAKLALDGATGTAGIINGKGASIFMMNDSTVINNVVGIDKNGKITGVAAGTADTDAVNYGQLKKVSDTANAGWTLSTNGNATAGTNVTPGAFVDFSGDNNVSVSNKGTAVSVKLNNALKDIESISNGDAKLALNGAAGTAGIINGQGASVYMQGSTTVINSKVSVDKDGKISGVAAGKISADSTDAVNGSQLHAVATEAGKHSKVVSGNNINVEETDVDGQKFYKVNMNKDIMLGDLTGKNVSISGTNGTIEATGAIATKDRVYADKGGKLADIDVTGNTISNGDAKLALNGAAGTAGIVNGKGASVYMQDGYTVINSKVSFDQNGKISGVAAGTADTDAVNVSQLKKVSDTANAGWNLSTNGVATEATNVKPGDYVDFSGDKNISVSHDGTKVQVELNKNIDVNYVQTNALNAKYNLSVGTANADGTMPFFVNSNGAFYGANNNFSVDKDGKVTATAGEIGNVVLQNGVYTGHSALRDAELFVGDADGNYSQITPKSAKLGQVTIDEKGNIAGVNSIQTNALNAKYNLSVGTANENGIMPFFVNSNGAFYGANNNFSVDKDGKVTATAGEIGNVVLQNGVYTGHSALRDGELFVGDASGNYSQITTKGAKLGKVTVAADGKISGVAAGAVTADSTDAVNGSQLHAVATEASKHSKVVGGNNISVEETDVDGQKFYKVNMNKDIILGDLTGKYVNISGTNGTIETTGYIATQDRVYADKGAKLADIDVAGNKISNGASSIVLDGSNVKVNDKVTIDQNGKISGVAAGEISKTSTDAINGSQLNQTNENVAALDKRVTANEEAIKQNADKINKLDNRVTQNEKDIKQNATDIAQNKTDIKNLGDRVTNVEELAKKHTTVTAGDNNITVDEGTNADGGKEYKVALSNKISVDSVTAGDTTISNKGLEIKDGPSVTKDGINAANKNITNVADGKVEKDSKDAINGGQLHQAKADINNRIDGVENQVVSNTNRINQLGSRVNKVGAGAAALAALHPMDFDPDDKLTFSAGYGNYGGENAAAIGAYYRPDEKVMFSVGGTVGNGENMVNAGVSFALDRTNHVSNSRTALAREVIDLRGQLAVMGAKMAKMEKAFGMLDETKTKLFPDVPANHWAYEYIAKLAGNGYIEGYPDGNFGGDRLMTRYEFAAMLYRAIENGAALEEKIIKEFEPELGRIRVDRISGEDGDRDKIERVRVNDTKGERDHYGNKLAK